jgi:hypothetical protein
MHQILSDTKRNEMNFGMGPLAPALMGAPPMAPEPVTPERRLWQAADSAVNVPRLEIERRLLDSFLPLFDEARERLLNSDLAARYMLVRRRLADAGGTIAQADDRLRAAESRLRFALTSDDESKLQEARQEVSRVQADTATARREKEFLGQLVQQERQALEREWNRLLSEAKVRATADAQQELQSARERLGHLLQQPEVQEACEALLLTARREEVVRLGENRPVGGLTPYGLVIWNWSDLEGRLHPTNIFQELDRREQKPAA